MIDLKTLRNIVIALVVFFNICYLFECNVVDTNKFKLENLVAQYEPQYKSYFEKKVTLDRNDEFHVPTQEEQLLRLLHKVEKNKDNEYWLANTTVEYPAASLSPIDFLPPIREGQITWTNRPLLYYEPRFTLAVYLDELKNQLAEHNPENIKDNDHLIELPFAWSDWVDLTALNEELVKPIQERRNCGWLQEDINKRTRFPDFCKNLVDMTDDEVNALGFTRDQLPGFVVKRSPMNKATHKPVLMQAKSYMLTHQENPLSIIFLTKNGTYEANISEKRERIIDTDLLEKFLQRRGINPFRLAGMNFSFNPQTEFKSLLSTIPTRPLDPFDDVHNFTSMTKNKADTSITRQVDIDPSYFHYGPEDVERQIEEYEERLKKVGMSVTNSLDLNAEGTKSNRLSRHERNHYNGLKYCNLFSASNEPTYYQLATLKKTQINLDTGWHYEWRFFNGAMKHLKDETWTYAQLEVREQIILDRLLRNWFRFAETKGIVSWIAHGPLLSWYWDGLMFPYDIDIDLQMPSSELNRLAVNYNMTLVVEDLNEGYGKYLIDCSTFLHHRNVPGRDNYIDARFIDIDTGSYIDITGIGSNNVKPPDAYNGYINRKKAKGETVELYMDRRKHWLTHEQINPLRYSLLGGVPVLIPNNIMGMLKHEYPVGVKSYYFQGYYYVPLLKLWVEESQILPLFKPESYESPTEQQRHINILTLIKNMDFETKLMLLETNKEILIEYYLTQKATGLHEQEKQLMLDRLLQHLILNLEGKDEYNKLTSQFSLGKPLRKSLFDFEYYGRFEHMGAGRYTKDTKEEEEEETDNWVI